ncbi:MAG: valine--tRNA ligase, partial [Deltaproteobacteria bacterium]
RPQAAAMAMAEGVEVFVPLEDLIPDPKREEARLQKELRRVMKELEFLQRKLSNRDFLERAPQEVVAKERGKLREYSDRRAKLEERLEAIRGLSSL